MSTFALSSIVHTDSGAVTLDGLSNDNVSPGLSHLDLGSDGNLYNTLQAVMAQRPSLSYETVHIKQHLDHIGLTAKAINTSTFLAAYFAENDEIARKATGLKLTCHAGLIVPRSIRAQQDQHAMLSVEVMMRKNSSQVPFSITTGQNVPAAGTIDEWYTLGDVLVNGVACDGVQEASVDFGVEAVALASDGEVYATECVVQRVVPRIVWTTTRADRLDTYTVLGQSHNVVLTLQKGAAGGRAGSGDMTFTTSQARVYVESIGAEHGSRSLLRVTAICGSANGTTHPLTRG
jgi:hypothetical protein